jgi:hypothetical protein
MPVNAAHVIEIHWVEQIPRQYREFQMLNNRETTNAHPPHRSYNHIIDLKDVVQPPWGLIHTLSVKELSVLQDYLKVMLDSGKICPRKSPAVAPILCFPNPQGRGFQWYMAYRSFNWVTIMN